MTYLKYTGYVPVSIESKLPSSDFHGTPTYAEVLDWLLKRDMWLEARYFGINVENYEFKDMRDEMYPHRICCQGDARALDIVIEEAVNYIIERNRLNPDP